MMSLEQARAHALRPRTEPPEYKRIFDAAPALFLLLGTDENFTILDASDAYLWATRTQREEIVGHGLFDAFPGASNLRASLQRVLAGRAADTMAVEKREMRRPESAGGGIEERYWSSVSSPVTSDSGEILWIVHVMEDVTELVRLKEELQREDDAMRLQLRRETEAALRESERRKDEFIATLSHELRNPLAPLRNGLNLLRLAPREEATAAVHEMMERQVSQLVRLVDDLLEMSRVTRGVLELRRERVELATVIRNAVETSQPLIRDAGHHLDVKLPRQLLWLEGDPVRLAQILANLLNNAARFTDSGGRITLVAEASGAGALISVRDTGIGFPPDAGPHLFEMFSKSDRSRGLGLGLGLARRLAEMHGGSIEAHSAGVGRGAEFIVHLPLAAAEDEAATSERGSEDEAPIACRVLVADDNRDAAETLADLLRELGGEVSLAYDGEQAVELARTTQPDLALVDIGMPKLDGYQVAQRIRREAGARPVKLVALTGWGQDEDRRRARDAGFDEHLVKPAELDTLRALLVAATQQRERDGSGAADGERPAAAKGTGGSAPRNGSDGSSPTVH